MDTFFAQILFYYFFKDTKPAALCLTVSVKSCFELHANANHSQ